MVEHKINSRMTEDNATYSVDKNEWIATASTRWPDAVLGAVTEVDQSMFGDLILRCDLVYVTCGNTEGRLPVAAWNSKESFGWVAKADVDAVPVVPVSLKVVSSTRLPVATGEGQQSNESEMVTAASSVEDLSLLGIDSTKAPTISRFPKRYNRDAHSVWKDAIDGLEFCDDNHKNWLATIKEFLGLCKVKGVEAFDKSSVKTVNDRIDNWLLSNRQAVVKFFNQSELFKRFTLRKVQRTVTVSAGKFTLQVDAVLKDPDDPTLQSWLMSKPMPGFTRTSEGYLKDLSAHSHVVANFIGDAASITIFIECPQLPVFETRKSKKQMAQHIEKNLWLPLVRKYRINGAASKLI